VGGERSDYLVETLPAIKMAALGDNGLPGGIEADVTVELASALRSDPHSLVSRRRVRAGQRRRDEG